MSNILIYFLSLSFYSPLLLLHMSNILTYVKYSIRHKHMSNILFAASSVAQHKHIHICAVSNIKKHILIYFLFLSFYSPLLLLHNINTYIFALCQIKKIDLFFIFIFLFAAPSVAQHKHIHICALSNKKKFFDLFFILSFYSPLLLLHSSLLHPLLHPLLLLSPLLLLHKHIHICAVSNKKK